MGITARGTKPIAGVFFERFVTALVRDVAGADDLRDLGDRLALHVECTGHGRARRFAGGFFLVGPQRAPIEKYRL